MVFPLCFYISYLRYIPLGWLLFLNWKIALSLVGINRVLQNILPVNDYANIQKIKRYYKRKMVNGTFTEEDQMYLNWVLEAEVKTL